MGASQSGESDAIVKFYQTYCKYTGGNENDIPGFKLGGAKDLSKYVGSIMSDAKARLIRDIAHDMAEKLKIPKLNPKNKSLDEIVHELKMYVPDPRMKKGNKKIWSDKESSQIATCRTMAEIINHRMNQEIINPKEKPGVICEQVIEIMYSLMTGMQVEFLSVRKDIERLLKNVNVLMEMLDQNYRAIDSKIREDKSESSIGSNTAVLREAHKDVNEELHRQMKLLENMLDVIIKPADIELSQALEDAKEFKSLVSKIKNYPGTGKFPEKLSYALSGLRTVAAAANIVDAALKKLGISYNEYANTKEAGDLKKLLANKTGELTLPEEALEAYEKAKRALFTHQYMHDEIVEELKHKRGRGEDNSAGKVEGGAKLDKRVKRRAELLKTILRSFAQRLNMIFEKILTASKEIGQGVGSGRIPLSDTLEKFPKALEILPDIQKLNVYYALSGYRNDVRSREERESFVNSARHVIKSLDDIIKDKEYAKEGRFRDMKHGFEEIVKLIEEYSHRYAEGFGPLPIYKEKSGANEDNITPQPVGMGELVEGSMEGGNMEGGHMDEVHNMEGAHEITGAHEKIDGGDLASYPEITKMAYQMSQLRDIIQYYFRTARIRVNLAKTSHEMGAYGEDYVKMLADAIAESVDKVTVEKRNFNTNEKVEAPVAPASSLYKEMVRGTDAEKAANKERLEEAMDLKNKMYDTKINMYRIAENVDLYMKAFASGITSHPDDIRNILKILNSTEVISKWFTEKSGDLLCNVFDTFPGSYRNNDPVYSNLPETSGLLGNKHYYVRVVAMCRLGNFDDVMLQHPELGKTAATVDWTTWYGANTISKPGIAINPAAAINPSLPGNPFLGLPAASADKYNGRELIKLIEKSLGVSMLKNIVSIFCTVGSHFGGTDLFKKTHMSAILMYKGLMDYIKYSAINMGGVIPHAAGAALPLTEVVDIVSATNNLPATVYGIGRSIRDNINSVRIGLTADDDLSAVALTPVGPAATVNTQYTRDNTYVTLSGVGELRSTNEGGLNKLVNIFKDTDQLFILTIKSMVAKVLTSIGVYNMFNRPINDNGLGYFSGLRLILGGDAAEVPKVVPEALELYIRLPLLAEFYRKIFDFADNSKQNRSITFVPEIDGVFSGLISLIFDKAQYVEQGNYSETDVRTMIEEINKIWLKFKHMKNPVSDVIHEFIAEINRRYGVYKKDERKRYLDEKQKRYEEKYQEVDEITDYELSTIDENDDYQRPSPSQSYQMEGGISSTKAVSHKYKLDLSGDQDEVRKLRNAIDKLFKDTQDTIENKDLKEINSGCISFTYLLDARKEELKYAKTDREKFMIVHSAINSLGQFAMTALEKSLIAFHEMVVSPLNNLFAMWNMLTMFDNKITKMYWAIKKLEAWANSQDPYIRPGPEIDNLLNPVYLDYILPYMHEGAIANFANPLTAKVWPSVPGNLGMEDAVIVRQNMQGLAGGDLTYGNLSTLLDNNRTAADFPAYKEIAKKFILDQSRMLIELIELLFGHATTLDKLVDMRIESAKNNVGDTCNISVNLDHSKLRQYITDSFNDVKKSLDKFRGLLPDTILKRYESINTPDAVGANDGSIYWLEKNLIDIVLDGKRPPLSGEALDPVLDVRPNDNLDRCSEKARYILSFLTKGWDVNANDLIAGGVLGKKPATLKELSPAGAQVDVPAGKKSMFEFPDFIWNFITYNPFRLGVGVAPNDYPTGANIKDLRDADFDTAQGLERLLFNISGKEKEGVQPRQRWFRDINVRNKKLYDAEKGIIFDDKRRSIWILFNRFLAAYVSQMFDQSSGKIYATTINTFANGSFSNAIVGDAHFNDVALPEVNEITDSSKNPGCKGILFKSLAKIINRLVMEKTINGDKKQYLETNIAEIPLYLKERMRADLPTFHKIFSYMIKRCELLKSFSHALNLTQALNYATAPPSTGLNHMTSIENDRYAVKVLDQIIQGCTALLTCIKDSLSEVTDSPKYCELRQDFIQDYEGTNGKMPFMPPSLITHYLKNMTLEEPNDTNENDISLPLFSVGDDRFKFQYGTRGVLNHEHIKMESMPGMLNIIKGHNHSSDSKHHFDEKDLGRIVNNNMELLRYLIDAKRYRSLFSLFKIYGADNLNANPPLGDINGLDNNLGLWTYTIRNLFSPYGEVMTKKLAWPLRDTTKLTDVIRMVESNNQNEQKRKIIVIVDIQDPCTLRGSRDNMLVFNIIDLNVVPINLHAMMRDIPLVNLYNYSWTFDKLITEIFGIPDPAHIAAGATLDENNVHSGKDALGYLLLNPYYDVSPMVYDEFVSRIIRGDLGIEGLGRPKYLGDEVYNKCLFGEIYPGELYYEEGGPPVGQGHMRGKTEVLIDIIQFNKNYLEFVKLLSLTLLKFFIRQPVGGYFNGDLNTNNDAMLKELVDDLTLEIINPNIGLRSIAHINANLIAYPLKAGVNPDDNKYNNLAAPPVNRFWDYLIFTASIIVIIGRNTIRDEIKGIMNNILSRSGESITDIRNYITNAMRIRRIPNYIAINYNPAGANDNPTGLGVGFDNIILNLGTAAQRGALVPFIQGAIPIAQVPALNNEIDSDLVNFIKYAYPSTSSQRYHDEKTAMQRDGSQPRYYENNLHYLEIDPKTKEGVVKHVDVRNFRTYLASLGKMRFDTKLIRNIFWLSNIQRALRLKLRRDLTWFDQKVVSDHAVTAAGITELFGNDMQLKSFPVPYKY